MLVSFATRFSKCYVKRLIRSQIFWLVLLGALLALTPACLAGDYYVSLDGNDVNPGTLALPWRSIQKAADSLGHWEDLWLRSAVQSSFLGIG